MRFSAFTTAVTALMSVSAVSAGVSLFGSDDMVAKHELDVPGESPLQFCEPDRANDIIEIKTVVLKPNPPEAGATLTITASGTVKEMIENGAYAKLQVKYGYIRLINMNADLCDQIKNVDLECPLEAGVITITKDIDLPKEIPPGKYTVHADVFSKDDKHITCLDAAVNFGRRDKSLAVEAPGDL